MSLVFTTYSLRTELYRIKLRKKKSGRGLRIAHLSDWHGKRFPQGQEYVYNEVAKAKPDIVVITGDLLSEKYGADDIRSELKAIGSDYNAFFVHGNNEHFWDQIKDVEAFLDACNIKTLTNRSVFISGVRIVGVDDAYEGFPDVERAFKNVRSSETVIVISHSPVIYRRILDRGKSFDLLLCGHTHGGQICLPGGWPLSLDSPGLPRYLGVGMHSVGRGQMLVNRGLGEHLIKLRMFCRPEVAIIELC